MLLSITSWYPPSTILVADTSVSFAVLGEGKDMEIEMLAEDPDYEIGEDYFEG